MTPADTARQIIAVGEAWARSRGYSRAEGLAALLDAVATRQIELCRADDGEVYWRFPERRQ